MSNFNIEWLKENLQTNATILYIGAADLNNAIAIKREFIDSTLHAFECSNYWADRFPMFDIAQQNGIHYYQTAVSDIDGEITFYPCEKYDGNDWPVSSSMFKPNNNLAFLEFSEPVTTKSITLKTFCEENDCSPDFVHIDVQGAEFKVFSKLGPTRPKIIWTEVSEFHRYETGVTYNDFYKLMIGLGYNRIYQDGPDELFVHNSFTCTEYKPKLANVEPVKENRLKFVFKNRDHVSPYEIHGVGKTSFYNIVYQLHLAEEPYHPDNLPEETFIYEYQQSWLLEPEKYWGENGFFEMDPCPENVLERIRQKTAYLFVTVPYESPLQFNRLIAIHSYLKRHKLPSSHVVYLTCCLNGNEVYKKYCDSIGDQPLCQLEYIAENLWINCFLSEKFALASYKPQFRKKTFLMFNRRWLGHAHRTLFLYNIFKNNMLDDFYMSFTKNDVDHQNVSYSTAVNNQYRNFFYKPDNPLDYTVLDNLENKLPLLLDTDDLVSGALMYDQFDTTKKFYDDSFVHVVSETYFNTDIVHITEKTFKPIIYRQPFVMLGPPTILRRLRELGFKTFGNIWDESYDDITDHTERFYKIIDLCKQIRDWSPLQKMGAMMKAKEVIDHNFFRIYSFKREKYVVKDIIEKYKLTEY